MLLPRIPQVFQRKLHARTHVFLSPTSNSLRSFLSLNPPSPSSTSLYLLSTSLPHVPDLLSALQTLPSSIGSFSSHPLDAPPSLSIATFESGVGIFRSGLSGRPPAEVGRRQRPTEVVEGYAEDKKGNEQGDVESMRREEGWAGLWKGGVGGGRIEALEAVKAESFLLLCDGTPRPVLSALDSMFPSASKVYRLPLEQGRKLTRDIAWPPDFPDTIHHWPTSYALPRSRSFLIRNNRPSVHRAALNLRQVWVGTAHRGIRSRRVSPPDSAQLRKSAQGNMLLKIEGGNGNPTQMLMMAIQRRDPGMAMNKDEEFHLAFLEQGVSEAIRAVADGQRVKKVVKILSGDPGRGALSLDMEEPVLAGQRVQFMHRPGPIRYPSPSSGRFTFSALARTEDADSSHEYGDPRVLEGFLGMSEDGTRIDSVMGYEMMRCIESVKVP